MTDIAQRFADVRSGGRGEFQICVREVGTANDLEAMVEFCRLWKLDKEQCYVHDGRLIPNGEGTHLQFFVPHGPSDPALYFEIDDFSQAPLEKWHRAACVAGDLLPKELSDRMLDEYGADLGAAAWLALMYDQECFDFYTPDHDGVRWCYACEASVELSKRLDGGTPVAPDRHDENVALPDGCIVYHGGWNYSVDSHEPIQLTEAEGDVLQAFIDSGSMDTATLVNRSGRESAVKTLKGLLTKYDGVFAPYIRVPGGRGKGGYAVKIRRDSMG